MSTYTLSVKNSSVNNTRFAVFQKAPDTVSGQNVFTLAWFSKYAYQKTIAEFSWKINYSAVWSRPDQRLQPGVICKTSAGIPVDPFADNTVSLSYDKNNDAFHFGDVTVGSPGSIFTNCDNSVPNSKTTENVVAGVGIGMSGSGTFLVYTQPNINLTWIPKPKYYLIAGDYKEGEILDVQTILGRSLEIDFNGALSVGAELNMNNQLIIT